MSEEAHQPDAPNAFDESMNVFGLRLCTRVLAWIAYIYNIKMIYFTYVFVYIGIVNLKIKNIYIWLRIGTRFEQLFYNKTSKFVTL